MSCEDNLLLMWDKFIKNVLKYHVLTEYQFLTQSLELCQIGININD